MKKIFALFLGVVFLTAIFGGIIFSTEAGLRLLIKAVNNGGSSFLTVGSVRGRLSDEWALGKIELSLPGLTVTVEELECHWSPIRLLVGELGVADLRIKKSRVVIREDKKEDVPSGSFNVLPKLALPIGLVIKNILIEDLNIVGEDGEKIFSAEKAGFQLSGQSDQFSLNDFFLKTSDFDLTLHGSLETGDGWTLDIIGGYHFFGAGFENLSGTFSLNGPLDTPQIQLGLYEPAAIRATGLITNLLKKPELKVTARGENVDLSDLSRSWPAIVLTTVNIELFGDKDGCKGEISAEGDWNDFKNIRIDSSISSNWDGINFQFLSITSQDGSVIGRDSWISWSDSFRWGGMFVFDNINPGIFVEELEGRISAELSSQGMVAEKGTEGSFEISRLEGMMHEQRISVQGDVFLDENKIYTDGLQIHSGELQGSAFIQQGSFSWGDTSYWSGDISFEDFDPSVIYSELPGQVSGRFVVDGQNGELGLGGSLTIKNLSGRLRGQLLAGDGNVEFKNDRLKTEGIRLQHGRSELQLRGIAGDEFALDVTILSPELNQLIPMVEGSLSVEGRLSGTLQDPELHLFLNADNLAYHQHHITTLKGEFQGQPSPDGKFKTSFLAEGITAAGKVLTGASAEISGSIEEHEMSLQASAGYGELEMQVAGGYSDESWEGSLSGITLRSYDYGVWRQTTTASLAAGVEAFNLADLCMTGNEGEFCLDGELNTSDEDVFWRIKSSLSGGVLDWINRWQLIPVVVSGRVSGRLEAEGDSRELLSGSVQIDLPEADFQIGESDEPLRHILLDDTSFSGYLDDGRFQGEVNTSMANGSTLYISAGIDNLGKFSVTPDQLSLTGKVDLKSVDLSFLAPLTGYVLESTGKLNSSLSLSGTLNRPRVDGELSMMEGGIALPAQGVILDDIKITVSAEKNGAQINSQASSGSGNIVASGRLEYEDNGISGDIVIRGNEFTLFSLPEYEIQISPDVRFLFGSEKGELSGTVTIPKARITPEEMTSSVSTSSDVVFINGKEEVKETGWPFYTKLNVQLGEDVLIDGYGLKGRLEGELQLQNGPDSFLTCTGGLDFIDSSFSIFGRSLDIERGQVLFTGGPIDNPGIDFRAQKKVSAEQAKGDGYVVGVDVNGLVQNLQFHLFSDPFMEDSDILSNMLVGHSLADSSAEEGNVLGAAAVAMGLQGSSEIFQSLGNIFSVDDLHLEGSGEKEDVSLVVGKRITKDLYFGYDVNMFSQLGVFRVRYGLTRGFSVETHSSTESTGTDILYTFER